MSRPEVYRAGPHRHDVEPSILGRTVACRVRVPDGIDPDRLTHAADLLGHRHEVLRTRLAFEPTSKSPVQHIGPVPRVVVRQADTTTPQLADPDGTALEIVYRGPGAPDLLLVGSSAVVDGGSLRILSDELAGLYAGRTLPDPTYQYVDVAEWLNELTDTSGAIDELNEIAGAAEGEPASRVEANKLIGSGGDTGGAVTRVTTVPAGEERLAEVLLTAWQALTSRITGLTSPTVWVQVDLRTIAELAEVTGPISMRLPLSIPREPDQQLGELLASVTSTARRWASRAELLTTAARSCGGFGFAYAEVQPSAWPIDELHHACGWFTIDLSVFRVGDRVRLTLWSPPQAGLPHDLAGALLESVLALAEQVAAAPGTSLAAALLPHDGSSLRATPAGPTARRWDGLCLHELVMVTAVQHPDREAIRCGTRSLTYDQLLAGAEVISAQLHHVGVRQDDVVAVAIGDPVQRLVAQLGVLSAGAGYLIVAGSEPVERAAFQLANSGATALVTDTQVVPGTDSDLPVIDSRAVVLDMNCPARENTEPALVRPNRSRTCSPAGLAYMIYTSGSTGRPKAAVVEHRNVVNYLAALVDLDLLASDTALPATSSTTFDAALKQVWGPLVVGGTVEFPAPSSSPVDVVLDALRGRRAATVNVVPSVWREVVGALDKESPSSPGGTVLLGGEVLTAELVRRTKAALPQAAVWNLYGPTEATANATAGLQEPERAVTLGSPVAGCAIYLLDNHLRPVPRGVIGEIFIGGAGVCRGYLGRPAETAEGFLPDPFGDRPGARMYRTGDLARVGASGLEYLGRRDHQVKLRGIRLEIEEVEAVLAGHDDVRQVAADVRDDRLVAYVVPVARMPGDQELRAHCARRLPAGAMPEVFIEVTDLPRLSSGKIDRGTLPDPVVQLCRTEQVQPRDDVEHMVAALWTEILDIDQVGVTDNFFAAGGDSIKAMRILARLSDVADVDLALHEFLEALTIAQQAELINARGYASHRGRHATDSAMGAADIEPVP